MKMLEDRELLPLLDGEKSWEERRKELLNILATYEYGFTPERPKVWNVDLIEESKIAFAGKALQQRFQMNYMTPGGMHFFHFYLLIYILINL